jgi:hypothetical protein
MLTAYKHDFLNSIDLTQIFEKLRKTNIGLDLVPIYAKILELNKTEPLPLVFNISGIDYTVYRQKCTGEPVIYEHIPPITKEEMRLIRECFKAEKVKKLALDFWQVKGICRAILNLYGEPTAEEIVLVKDNLSKILYFSGEIKADENIRQALSQKLFRLLEKHKGFKK